MEGREARSGEFPACTSLVDWAYLSSRSFLSFDVERTRTCASFQGYKGEHDAELALNIPVVAGPPDKTRVR
jgi:hypothetical protein